MSETGSSQRRRAISGVALILLYLLLAPVYTLVRWFVFRNVEMVAKAKRRAVLAEGMRGVEDGDLARMQLYVAEFARCREAKIRPM